MDEVLRLNAPELALMLRGEHRRHQRDARLLLGQLVSLLPSAVCAGIGLALSKDKGPRAASAFIRRAQRLAAKYGEPVVRKGRKVRR